MEAINLDDINIEEVPSINNENEYLEMCNDFKERMEIKNKKLYTMKILLIKLFGMLSIAEEYEDISLLEVACSMLKKFVEDECDCEPN
tara:strand:+ start:6874 stop:7137 length:264 start_codon:yes stop_codon:yes gene_type:complete